MKKMVVGILLILLSFLFIAMQYDISYTSYQSAIKKNIEEKEIETMYVYDDEVFIFKTNGFKYIYKSKKDNKWRISSKPFYKNKFTEDILSPGFDYYKSDVSNRMFITIFYPYKSVKDEVIIKDNKDSKFKKHKVRKDYIDYSTVIEIENDEIYKITINDKDYEVKISELLGGKNE